MFIRWYSPKYKGYVEIMETYVHVVCSACLIMYTYPTLCAADVALTQSVNGTSKEDTPGSPSFPVGTTVAAVVGVSMLLFAFVIIVAFLFCCKSSLRSESIEPPEDSTSIMSLNDHVDNNAHVIGNRAILMHEIVAKGRNKITKMKASRRKDDIEQLQNEM